MFAKDLITELIKSEKLPAAGQNFFNTGIEVFVDQQKIEVKGIISKENIIKIGTCFVRTMEKEI